MNVSQDRLFNYHQAFAHPATQLFVIGVGAVLGFAFLVIALLSALGIAKEPLRTELWKRTRSWGIILPIIVLPILAGAFWHILLFSILSIWSYAEFARATGLFRERLVSFLVVLGILALQFAALDNWYGFFVALHPIVVSFIAALSILRDSPEGYIQRVALGVLAFMLFGVGLSHLSFMGNDPNYRPIVFLLIFGTQLNDIFAFVVGKTLGRRKLCPHTSPNKTLAGSLGAIALTTAFTFFMGHQVFAGTAFDTTPLLLALGVLISISGQCGDLMLSSIKRDLGIKDMANTIPGHGGVIDRINSLLLSAPVVFHLVAYILGFGIDQPQRIISG